MPQGRSEHTGICGHTDRAILSWKLYSGGVYLLWVKKSTLLISTTLTNWHGGGIITVRFGIVICKGEGKGAPGLAATCSHQRCLDSQLVCECQ